MSREPVSGLVSFALRHGSGAFLQDPPGRGLTFDINGAYVWLWPAALADDMAVEVERALPWVSGKLQPARARP